MGMPTVYAQTLRRAAEIVGGATQLSTRLRVPYEDLVYWLEGTKRVPEDIFLRAVDIVTAYGIDDIG